jgi:hypothetical protein
MPGSCGLIEERYARARGLRGARQQRQDVHRAPSRLALYWTRSVQG